LKSDRSPTEKLKVCFVLRLLSFFVLDAVTAFRTASN
jgi:hypothetical protein